MKPTMTLKEVTDIMRNAGFRISETTVANGIETGRYPFGEMIGAGKSGRRQFEILRVDFERWMKRVAQ